VNPFSRPSQALTPQGFSRPGGGQSGLSPSQLGWANWWKPVEGGSLTLSGNDVISVADEIGGATLGGDPTFYGQWDGSKITYNGTTQYHYSTAAALLALVNGDDEPVTIAMLGALTGSQATGRAASWSSTAANRTCGFGNNAAGSTGYRIHRVSGNVEAVVAHTTTEAAWFLTLNGATNTLEIDSTTVVSGDLSAQGAQAYTHFMLGARYTSTGPAVTEWIAMNWRQLAIKAGVASAQEKADLRAYWGRP
jgi:hypothetical protein